MSRRRIRELVDRRTEAYLRHRRAVPGAPALLRDLHAAGKTIGVVTNNLVAEQEAKLRAIGLEDLVYHLVCSEEVGVTKPDPRIFRTALQRAAASPRGSVMVGDSWEYDVVGATRVGMRSVWFHRDARPLPPSPPAAELRSFRPLRQATAVILGARRQAPARKK